MACCLDKKIEIENCMLTIRDAEGNILSNCVKGYEVVENCKEVNFQLCDGKEKLIDFRYVIGHTWDGFKTYISDALVGCCVGGDITLEEDKFVGVETIYRLDEECKLIAIEKCKNRLGEISYQLEGTTTPVNINDYTIPNQADLIQDIKEYNVSILQGGAEQMLVPSITYDAISIHNKSECPLLAKITIEKKDGTTIDRKVKISPHQIRNFDWTATVIKGIRIGECPALTTGITDIDTLICVAASADIEALITLFNS